MSDLLPPAVRIAFAVAQSKVSNALALAVARRTQFSFSTLHTALRFTLYNVHMGFA